MLLAADRTQSGDHTIHVPMSSKKQEVHGLLFDLDGTLVDSSAIVQMVMEKWCRTHGIPLQAVLDVCHGGRTEDTVALVAPHLCAPSEAAEIEAEESNALEGLMPVDGARDFLASLEAVQWAVVTSNSLVTAIPKLNACQLPVPDVFITSESVTQGKPHPEPFLKAAEALGVSAAACLVFEDADNGVRSALAAGCTVILVGDTCVIQHERIIGRIASFKEIVIDGGDLRVGGRAVAFVHPAKG